MAYGVYAITESGLLLDAMASGLVASWKMALLTKLYFAASILCACSRQEPPPPPTSTSQLALPLTVLKSEDKHALRTVDTAPLELGEGDARTGTCEVRLKNGLGVEHVPVGARIEQLEDDG